jgi:hypothetical protein
MKCWTTLLTKLSYIPGTLTLHQCLVDVDSVYPLVVMVPADLPQDAVDILASRGIKTRQVEYLKPREGDHDLDAADERFRDTWTKLRAFSLQEYEV